MGLQAQMKQGGGPLVFSPDKNHRVWTGTLSSLSQTGWAKTKGTFTRCGNETVSVNIVCTLQLVKHKKRSNQMAGVRGQ